MQSDRELLEMAARAARAAGVQVIDTEAGPQIIEWTNGSCESYRVWRPLTDDGDALRLAVALRLDVQFEAGSVSITNVVFSDDEGFETEAAYMLADDATGATRRAIVRAVAAIGQEKEQQG